MSQLLNQKQATTKGAQKDSLKPAKPNTQPKGKKPPTQKQRSSLVQPKEALNSDLEADGTGYFSVKNSTMASTAGRPQSQGKQAITQSAKIYSQKMAEIEKGVQEVRDKKEAQEDNFKMEKVELGLCMNPESQSPKRYAPAPEKKIKAKVNTGLSRSKSNMSKKKASKLDSSPKYREGASPREKLDQDLQFMKRQMTIQLQEGIKSQIDQKYSQIEQLLCNNLPTGTSPKKDKKSDASDFFERASNQEFLQDEQLKKLQDNLIQQSKQQQQELPKPQPKVEKPVIETRVQEIVHERVNTPIQVKKLTNTISENEQNQIDKLVEEIVKQEQPEPVAQEKPKKETKTDKLNRLSRPKTATYKDESPKKIVKKQQSLKKEKPQPTVEKKETAPKVEKKEKEKNQPPQPQVQKPKIITSNKKAPTSRLNAKQESEKFNQTQQSPVLPKMSNYMRPKTPKNNQHQKIPPVPKVTNQSKSLEKKRRSSHSAVKSVSSAKLPIQSKQKLSNAPLNQDIISTPTSKPFEYTPKDLYVPKQLSKQTAGCRSVSSFKKCQKPKLDFSATNALERIANSKMKESDSPSVGHQGLDLSNLNQSQFTQNFNLTSKEDYLNFDINQIWKEMDEIGKNRQEKSEAFAQFQDQFYDRKAAKFNDKTECSPTKRLVQIKNATFKHHALQHEKGIKGDGYQIQYTTGPHKSYVIKPEEGEIQYAKYSRQQTHKLVNRILEGEVEEIKMLEKSKNPQRREKLNSPVKILASHKKRIDMQVNKQQPLLSEQMSSPKMFGGSVHTGSDEAEAQSADCNNINIAIDSEGLMQEEVPQFMHTQELSSQLQGQSLLIEGRK